MGRMARICHRLGAQRYRDRAVGMWGRLLRGGGLTWLQGGRARGGVAWAAPLDSIEAGAQLVRDPPSRWQAGSTVMTFIASRYLPISALRLRSGASADEHVEGAVGVDLAAVGDGERRSTLMLSAQNPVGVRVHGFDGLDRYECVGRVADAGTRCRTGRSQIVVPAPTLPPPAVIRKRIAVSVLRLA